MLHDEVVPFDDLSASGTLRGTAALSAMVDRGELNFEGAMVDVEPGTDLVALTDAIEDLGQHEDLGTGGPVFVSDQAAAVRRTNDAMRPLAFALGVAAVAIGLVVLLVVGQAVSRASREAQRRCRSAPRHRLPIRATASRSSPAARRSSAWPGRSAPWSSPWRFPAGSRSAWRGWPSPNPACASTRSSSSAGAGVIVVLTTVSALPAALLGAHRRPQATQALPPRRRGGGERPVAGRGAGRSVRGVRRRLPSGPDAQHTRRRDRGDHVGPRHRDLRRQPRCAHRHAEPLRPGLGPDGRRPVRAGPGDESHRPAGDGSGCPRHRSRQLRRRHRQRRARAGVRSPVRTRASSRSASSRDGPPRRPTRSSSAARRSTASVSKSATASTSTLAQVSSRC